MTETATLRLQLLSAATFGRGDGVAGLIDREVEHDRDGFPFLRGRTLKGLLREAAEDFVFALGGAADASDSKEAKDALFGIAGSGLTGQGSLHVGDARLPHNVRRLFHAEVEREKQSTRAEQKLTSEEILASLTSIRRQTAMNAYGAPDHATLRSMRVVLRETIFEAELSFTVEPDAGREKLWALLVAATLGLRAAGTGRNRGRGRVRATLNDEETMRRYWTQLQTVR